MIYTDLIISEYVEGSSNNKALEFFNGTSQSIDLAAGGYSIKTYFNGSISAEQIRNLVGVIPPGGVFVLAHVDAVRNRLIEARELFRGTLSQTVVYPREVVKAALLANAAAVIFAHNHPSGMPDPSQADRMLTDALRGALSTIDIRVLDHIIVAGSKTTSFAERGLL